MIIAWWGEPTLKAAAMERLRDHRRLDQMVQGLYVDGEGDNFRGCHLGCLTHVDDNAHLTAERLFGIEQRVGYLLEAVFEGLPSERCADWVIRSTESIPVGADLSKCHHHFGAWLLGESGLLHITDINRSAIEQVRELHVLAAAGSIVTQSQWSAAESAAESADERARAAGIDQPRTAAGVLCEGHQYANALAERSGAMIPGWLVGFGLCCVLAIGVSVLGLIEAAIERSRWR